MESNDPFGSIVEHCHVSSSQEDRFNHCRFTGEPDEPLSSAENPEEFPVESTGIMLVSPPETSEDKENDNNTPRDIFQTPPEESFSVSVDHINEDPTVDEARDGGGGDDGAAAAVDLGRDTDLAFSEVELTQRIDSEEIQLESEKVRVLKRESPINEGKTESPMKRSKISGLETPKSCLGIETEINRERLVKSMEKLKFKVVSPYNYGAKSPQTDLGNENCEESITKRKLEFSTEVLESQIEEENNGVRNSVTRSIEDIDKFRYVGPSKGLLRTLPVSIQGPVKDGGGNLEAEKNCREVTLLDVLKLLAGDCEFGGLKGVSVLDVAKRRGMTFPRPSWWPEEGFEAVDD